MMNIKQAVPFFMVTDMQISIAFYVDRLGFELKDKWDPLGKIEWCWLERDGVSLMLQQPRNAAKAGNDIPQGTGVSICFQCDDAIALYREFITKEVQIKEPFVGNNRWVVNFSDPDGYRMDFESWTDVPEETKYSEWLEAGNKT